MTSLGHDGPASRTKHLVDSLPADATEILQRVERASAERGWSPDAFRHLVTEGMVPMLDGAPRPAHGDGTAAGTVPMDTAVAAVAGVVAGMIGWEEQDERRHRRRLAAARTGGADASLQNLSSRSLVAVAARRAAARLRGSATRARR